MTAPATLGCPVPVLRVPRWEDAADFYLDHLGFEVLWQHRPGIDHTAPGGPTIELIDPCGNVLRFCGTARNDFASREEHPMPP